jgi:hypothetical protein
VVSATPRSLYPRERLGIHCIGCCVGPRPGLDGWGKSRPHLDSIPGPSIYTRQSVAVPIINFGTRMRCGEAHAPAAVLSDIWRRFGRRCSLYQQCRPSGPPLTLHPITEDANVCGGTQSLLPVLHFLVLVCCRICSYVWFTFHRGFEYRREHRWFSVLSVVYCQVEVSASDRSLIQRSRNECGVSECDRKASILRRSGFGECGHGCLSLVSVLCCLVEVSAMGRSLFQRIPTQCGVSEPNGTEEIELERDTLFVFLGDS